MPVELIARYNPKGGAKRLQDLEDANVLTVWKEPVRVATTGNITLSGRQVIDGVSLVPTNRVLVKDQTTGSQNGIYECRDSTWFRTSDADHSDKLRGGTVVAVWEGTANGGKRLRLQTNSVVLDTTAQVWVDDGASGMASLSGATFVGDITAPRVGVNATAWSTVEKFRVNTPTAADVLAASVMSSTGATHKPLVLQGPAGMSGNYLEAQTSTGSVVASLSAAGSFLASSIRTGSSPATTGALRLSAGEGLNWRNTAGNADVAGWSLNSSDELQHGAPVVPNADATRYLGTTSRRYTYVHSVRAEINSTGSFGAGEYFRVGTPSTVDVLANVTVSTDVGSNKAMVLQQRPAQSATMVEVQTSAGSPVFTIGVNGATTVASLDAGSGTITTTGTSNAANFIASSSVRIGASPAATGALRMSSTGQMNWRNVAGTGDIGGFASNASDQLTTGADFIPSSDALRALGVSTSRWASAAIANSVSVGSTVAASGLMRFPSNSTVLAVRNAAGTADITAFSVNSSNVITVGGSNQGGVTIGTVGGGTGATTITSAGGITLSAPTGITVTDSHNLLFGTTTGTKLGTTALQKMALWGNTPVVRPTGWALPTGTLTRTTFDPSTASLTDVAQRLAALVTDLTTIGAIGS